MLREWDFGHFFLVFLIAITIIGYFLGDPVMFITGIVITSCALILLLAQEARS